LSTSENGSDLRKRVCTALAKLHLTTGGTLVHCSKIRVKPGKVIGAKLKCLLALRPTLRDSIKIEQVIWAANRQVSPTFNEVTIEDLPKIDLVFPTTAKDFLILPFAIQAAVHATRNPIGSIKVYAPRSQLDRCSKAIEESSSLHESIQAIDVLSDESILTEKTFTVLKERFGNRAGWYLQQMIKLSSVLKSAAAGVLVVDSDTILLKPRIWMIKDGRQILTPTYELHQPYRNYLSTLGSHFEGLEKSFVSHHMLMQPNVLNSIFNSIGIHSIEELATNISNFGKEEELVEFFSEYEFYSHGLISIKPCTFEFVKWANLSMQRPDSSLEIDEVVRKLKFTGEFYSVSMHDYL
jgi:hypothetical protein